MVATILVPPAPSTFKSIVLDSRNYENDTSTSNRFSVPHSHDNTIVIQGCMLGISGGVGKFSGLFAINHPKYINSLRTNKRGKMFLCTLIYSTKSAFKHKRTYLFLDQLYRRRVIVCNQVQNTLFACAQNEVKYLHQCIQHNV